MSKFFEIHTVSSTGTGRSEFVNLDDVAYASGSDNFGVQVVLKGLPNPHFVPSSHADAFKAALRERA
jgi:hypothetical protein